MDMVVDMDMILLLVLVSYIHGMPCNGISCYVLYHGVYLCNGDFITNPTSDIFPQNVATNNGAQYFQVSTPSAMECVNPGKTK